MSKVITFSKTFPNGHAKEGQPTFFVEKIFAGLADTQDNWEMPNKFTEYDWYAYYNCANAKFHTIRSGHRFKVGDKFSPRIWSGKPYQSKQLVFSSDIEIKKVWDFKINVDDDYVLITIDDWPLFEENMTFQTHFDALEELAKNDGLTVDDFKSWFKYPSNFNGQIICWNEKLDY